MSNSKGIMELLRDAPEVSYDPQKGITIEQLTESMVALSEYKPRKTEYILSKWQAENLPMWQLEWLGSNYIVLVNMEIRNIIQDREKK